MDDQQRADEEERERPRPRVVDKRVSARPPSSTPPPTPEPEPPAQPQAASPGPGVEAPAPEPPREPAAAQAPEAQGQVWTPEQEEQARRIAEELARTPGPDLVVTFAMNFVEVASVKLEAGDLPGAQLAIDSFEGILTAVGPRLGEAEGAMRSVLAQLQMAFAQRAAGPP